MIPEQGRYCGVGGVWRLIQLFCCGLPKKKILGAAKRAVRPPELSKRPLLLLRHDDIHLSPFQRVLYLPTCLSPPIRWWRACASQLSRSMAVSTRVTVRDRWVTSTRRATTWSTGIRSAPMLLQMTWMNSRLGIGLDIQLTGQILMSVYSSHLSSLRLRSLSGADTPRTLRKTGELSRWSIVSKDRTTSIFGVSAMERKLCNARLRSTRASDNCVARMSNDNWWTSTIPCLNWMWVEAFPNAQFLSEFWPFLRLPATYFVFRLEPWHLSVSSIYPSTASLVDRILYVLYVQHTWLE